MNFLVHFGPFLIQMDDKPFLCFAQMDEFGMEPSDVLYELIGASMTSPPLRDEAGEYFYRIFADLFSSDFTRAPYLVLKETEQQIYRGTTGLSCWQVSIYLIWILIKQYLDIFDL